MAEIFTAADAILAVAFQGTDLFLMARISVDVNRQKVYLLQSHLASIEYQVYENKIPYQPTPLALDPLTVVFNTIQLGANPIWKIDKIGYNFGTKLSRTLIPDPRKTYHIPYTFILAGTNDHFIVKYKIKTNSITD